MAARQHRRQRSQPLARWAAAHTHLHWLTTGSIERLNTIWEAWIGPAVLPACCATEGDLTIDNHP